MPLYMDRHDISEAGLTPEKLAQLHWCDLKVQDKYGVKMLTYWWHEGASAGFCLNRCSWRMAVVPAQA